MESLSPRHWAQAQWGRKDAGVIVIRLRLAVERIMLDNLCMGAYWFLNPFLRPDKALTGSVLFRTEHPNLDSAILRMVHWIFGIRRAVPANSSGVELIRIQVVFLN